MKLSDVEERHKSVLVVSSEVISNIIISKDVESSSDHITIQKENCNSQSNDDDDDNDLWKVKKASKARKIIDDPSDEELTKESEDDQESELSSAEGVSSDLNTFKSRIKGCKLDSDSEDEDVSPSTPVENVGCHSDSTKSQPENKNNVPSYMSMFKNSDLYDAEGSSDEESQKIGVTQHEEERNDAADECQSKSAKKKIAPPRKSKQTALEEIHSETQRLVRQSRICLPYHQPKQRSLSEFLSRRKVPVIPLKTNSAQLSEVWMQIEEREKTAETFYKSESDSDEECNKIVTDEKTDKFDKDESSAPDKMTVDSGIPHTNTSNLTLEETNFKNKEKEISNTDVDTILLTNDSAYSSPINSEKFDEEISSNKPVVENDTNKRDEKILEFSESDSLKLQLTENTLLEISTAKVSDVDTEQDSLEIVSKSFEENEESLQLKNHDQSESTLSDGNNGMVDEVIEISASENTEQFESKKKIHNLLQNTLLDIKLDSMPRISGSPDSFIDLEEGSKKPGAFQLVTRFMKHAKLKPRMKKEEKMSVSVAEVNGKGEVISLNEEVINIKVGENSKPGETRMQLQAKLKEKIAQRREKEFVKRIEEYKLSEEMFEGETKDEVSEDEEVEEDFKISESSASESEPEENDMDITDKDKGDNPFLDEEAEESDNEGDEDEDDYSIKEKELDENEDDVEEEDVNPESVPLSTNIVQLLDIKSGVSKNALQNTANLGIISGLTGLCSGGFPSQDLNLEDLEKNEKFSFEEPKKGLNWKDLEKNEKFTLEEPKKITDVIVPEDASDEDSANEIDIAKPMEEENNAADSSDDEIVITKPKKKKLRLTYSDDENDDPKPSEDENSNESDNEEVNEDDVNDSENENVEDVDEGDNNSEDGDQKEELDEDEDEEAFLKNPSVAAKRFFEDEAELSGSEYGSADEDEADLDKYEKEDGDDDVFSKQNVHTELERLHMRYMLDDDKKEIRIIKELLFEDGELHSDGPKRQRQFKWYNQDENMFPDQGSVFDDEDKTDHPEEEEEDESWRKTRLERETYLQQLQDNDNAIGLKDISCLKSNIIVKSSPKFPTPKADTAEFKSPNPRKQLTLITKRGSFLSRGEKVLSKIAEITNVASDNPVGNSRGKRNMVFAIVSPPKETEPSEQTSKRKNTDQPSTAAKRLKFAPVHLNKSKNSIFEKLKLHET